MVFVRQVKHGAGVLRREGLKVRLNSVTPIICHPQTL